MIPSANPITGWDMLVYDPIVAESRIVGNQFESAGESIGMVVENVAEEPVLYNDLIVVKDIDEGEPILQFKRTVQTVPPTND